MRVLYIHQYFRKVIDGGPIRSYYLAKELIDNGIDVDLVTSHNHKGIRVENIEGINVHFLPVKYDNKLPIWKRLIAFVKFTYLCFNYCKKLQKPDYVYATSTPLSVGIIALSLKKIKKIPYIFEVRDLWPEAPIQLGIIKNTVIKKLLYTLEKLIYKHAHKIVVLSPGMKKGVERYKQNKEIHLIPNISDCEYFNPEEKNLKETFFFGVGEKFVVSYIGAVGKVNNIDSLLAVADECQKQNVKDISFLIAGRGSELKKYKTQANEMGLKNIRFLGFMNRNELKRLFNVTDCSFISFLDLPILETNSPNKFFDSIASGKLCVVNNKGWINELIDENKIGFYYPSKHPKVFVEKIKAYINNKALLKESQKKSRMLAERQFSRKDLCKQFITLFDLPLKKEEESRAVNQAYNSKV